ncbi:hypothetical protein KIW84_053837 [Lathyrus oleraceus]|uniref:HMA domain-containing protein n=1 Tax=Pisum sativum TaxID=3888 RepID=A0A9D4WU06_PEA|nr:hypothetical protein KIW84_053837 [Pisum sativum]
MNGLKLVRVDKMDRSCLLQTCTMLGNAVVILTANCSVKNSKKCCTTCIRQWSKAMVVEVKVGLHCDDCIKKILKAIKKIQDIETYNVDTKLNKVIVTGNVTTEQVTRVLHKIGKNATPFQEDAI